MGPEVTGFLMGLMLGAAKVGGIGTIGFGIAWWTQRQRIQRLERELESPARLDERLANLEQTTEYIGARLADLADTQALLARQLGAPALRENTPPQKPRAEDSAEIRTPH